MFSVYELTSLLSIKQTWKPVAKTFQPRLRISSEPAKEHISHWESISSELKAHFSSKNYETIFSST